MTDAKLQQEVAVPLMDDTAFGEDMELSYMDAGPSEETPSSSGQFADSEPWESTSASSCHSSTNTHTVPSVAGNLTADIAEFIVGLRRHVKNIFSEELDAATDERVRQSLLLWNTFLTVKQGTPDTFAIISSDIKNDINKFIRRLEEQLGEQLAENNKLWIKNWLSEWNMFLQARAGETLVTRWNVCLTIVGFIFYIVDLVSDVGTSVYYAANRQWWRAMATLTLVYGAVIFHTVEKWRTNQIHCTGAAAWLRYVASLLVNWPDLEQYGTLCRVEWQLYKSPACSAHLVPEWHQRRARVAHLKYTEGVYEACPQAVLQLCILVPDLYGHWTWTDYLRIAGAYVSLCTAGAALVNWEKFWRINDCSDLPLSELVMLHVWAVPVTVSRLLSVTLLLSVHLYWALAGVALHLVLYGVYLCRTWGVPRTPRDVIHICLTTLRFFMSPFDVYGSVTSRRVRHAVHFLVNTAVMVVWALSTPLVCAHPALYTAIICCNVVMFVVGLVAWQLHEHYWPGSYPLYNDDDSN